MFDFFVWLGDAVREASDSNTSNIERADIDQVKDELKQDIAKTLDTFKVKNYLTIKKLNFLFKVVKNLLYFI